MIRNSRLKYTLGVGLAAIVLIASFSTYKKQSQNAGNLIQTERIEKIIVLADSLRNSKPDSAISYFKNSISLLGDFINDLNKAHLAARAYTRIAITYSDNGNYKLALENDSIAKEIAISHNDNQMLANAFVGEGVTLFRTGKYEKAMECYEKALKLASQINDLEIQAKIYANQAIIYFYRGENRKSVEGFKKAFEVGKQLKNEELVAGNYMNLAIVYNNIGKSDSVLFNYQLALEIFKKINDKNGELLCSQNLGTKYYGFSDYSKAIEYFNLSLNLALEMNDRLDIAKGYQNLADVYAHLGDNEKATELIFKSIKIKEQLNDQLSLAKGYYGIGSLYFSQKDLSKARIYFDKSLKICLELKNINEIEKNYNSIASIYSGEGKSDSAIFYFNKSIELSKQIEDVEGLSNLYINLGSEYSARKEYSRSEKFLTLALKSKSALQDDEGIAIANHHLANLFFLQSFKASGITKKDVLQKAENKGLMAYKSAKKIGAIPVQRAASGVLKKIFQQEGNFPEAFKYSEMYNSLSDSILNKEKIKDLTFAEARWNVERKQQEIDNLEKTKELNLEIIQQQKTESRQQKLIIWFIVALLLLVLISMVIIMLYLQNRRETLYQKQMAAITALRMQNARNTMSPHFFFNLLASLSGLSGHPEKLKEKLKSLSFLLRKVVENIDRTAVTLDEELAAVRAFIDLYSDKIPDPFTVEYLIEDETKLNRLILAMMIQIPVENALKHGLMPLEGEKKLTISITHVDNYQNITITDNGVGLKASTGRSAGTGTGIKVLLQTIHLLNTKNTEKIKFSIRERETGNGETHGTTVDIKIPSEFNYQI